MVQSLLDIEKHQPELAPEDIYLRCLHEAECGPGKL
jgi:hypothetical protein